MWHVLCAQEPKSPGLEWHDKDRECWQVRPISLTWPCNGGWGMWPVVGWWRKPPTQRSLCRALHLLHPVAAEPPLAVETYTPSLDIPALSGSSRRWTRSPLQSHTWGTERQHAVNPNICGCSELFGLNWTLVARIICELRYTPHIRHIRAPLQVFGDGVEVYKESREKQHWDSCDRSYKCSHLQKCTEDYNMYTISWEILYRTMQSCCTCREVEAAPTSRPRDWATRAVQMDRAMKSR